MTRAPSSARVIACGVSESGKDYLLRKLFLNRCARSLVLDPLGEYARERPPLGRQFHARSLEELRVQLRAAARSGRAWRVVASIGAEQAADIARLLVPPLLDSRGGAFPLYVGGMALVCTELDLFAPTNADPAVIGLWRRGRHVGLTILGASQRPHGISRIVTSQSGWMIVTRTWEARDLRYLEDALPPAAFRQVERLPWRWAIIVDRRLARWWMLDDRQLVRAQGDMDATPPPPAPAVV